MGTSVTSRAAKFGHLAASIVVTGEEKGFLQSRVKKSAPLLDEEVSHGRTFTQPDRSVASVVGFGAFSKSLQQISTNLPARLIKQQGVSGKILLRALEPHGSLVADGGGDTFVPVPL
jgi:hypothetical protein